MRVPEVWKGWQVQSLIAWVQGLGFSPQSLNLYCERWAERGDRLDVVWCQARHGMQSNMQSATAPAVPLTRGIKRILRV